MKKKIELPKKEKTVNTNFADRIYTWEEKNEFCEKMGKKKKKKYGPGSILNDAIFTILSCGASFEYVENNIDKLICIED